MNPGPKHPDRQHENHSEPQDRVLGQQLTVQPVLTDRAPECGDPGVPWAECFRFAPDHRLRTRSECREAISGSYELRSQRRDSAECRVLKRAIKVGTATAGKYPGTVEHVFENVTVITNDAGDRVITLSRRVTENESTDHRTR